MRRFLLIFMLALASSLAMSGQQLRLPTVIGNGMVLQQNRDVNVWGWARPSAKIKVEAKWLDKAVETKADADGKWLVTIPTPAGSYDTHTLTVTDGKSEITLTDILVGEVWLCSGQSNMAWKVKQTRDFDEERTDAVSIARNIRLYSTGRICAEMPQDDVPDALWQRCTPETVGDFSAVGYGFGLELQRALDVPVGLIQAAYGGTFLEGWVSEDTLRDGEKASSLQKAVRIINKRKGKWAGNECHLWNANIHPLLNVSVAGVIWYQGCANVSVNPVGYRETLQGLISSWRQEFNNPDMPFYIAQIAPHTYDDVQGALLRESQAYVADKVPGCALVATIDNQEIPGDIHPRFKKDVCHRFALCALGQHYGKDVGQWKSPAFDRLEVAGSELIVHFKNLPSALMIKGDRITGFQIGETMGDGSVRYVLADARIDQTGTRIILTAAGVSNPTDVRYCFDESVGNVFSAEGLPLVPFRSDRKNKPVTLSARAYIEPAVATPVSFEGDGYIKTTMKVGTKFWTDSEMALYEGSFPSEFEGFELLVSERVPKGGQSNGGKVIAMEDGRIYFIARTDKATRKTWYKGWRMIVPSQISLRRVVGEDADGLPKYKIADGLYIHYIDVKKGDVINLHTTDSWGGVIPLASSIEYAE